MMNTMNNTKNSTKNSSKNKDQHKLLEEEEVAALEVVGDSEFGPDYEDG
jgi:hypothetical protein